ncbi:MAG: hypothetical protein R3C99_09490 [Pirellulaceae bacterium]
MKIMKESGASDLSLAIGAAINDPGKALQKMYQSVENDIKAADQAAKSGDYRRSGERSANWRSTPTMRYPT